MKFDPEKRYNNIIQYDKRNRTIVINRVSSVNFSILAYTIGYEEAAN